MNKCGCIKSYCSIIKAGRKHIILLLCSIGTLFVKLFENSSGVNVSSISYIKSYLEHYNFQNITPATYNIFDRYILWFKFIYKRWASNIVDSA